MREEIEGISGLVSLTQASKLLGLKRDTLKHRLYTGGIPYVVLAGRILVRPSDLRYPGDRVIESRDTASS